MTEITARDVLPALYAGCVGFVELRALPSRHQCFTVPNDNATRATFVRRHAGQNLYWGIATRRSEANGTEANCLHLGALYADLDFAKTPEAGARERLAQSPLHPSLVVHSGGGLHVYWFIREPLEVQTEAPRPWLSRLATYLQADPVCAEPARVLRIPGTRNHKYNPARLVTVERFDPMARYNLSDFDEWLPADTAASTIAPAGEAITGPILDGNRNNSIYKLARSLRVKGIEAPAITLAIQAVNQAQCHPPLPESEIAAIVQNAMRQRDRSDFTPSTINASTPVEAYPVIVRLSDVQPETVRWLWLARLALGKLTLLIGDPGLGKSWITLFIAAALSVGRRWPDGDEPRQGPVNSLLLTAEDGVADTVRPRLDSMGADVTRVHHLAILKAGDAERAVQLADIGMIERAMLETDSRLLIVDPISAYVGATDSHKDAPVRSLLAPLSAMLERRSAAGLCVMHLKKDSKGPAVHRAGGSIAFAAAARIVLAVAADHERGGRRVLASVKQNLAVDPPALGYSLEGGCLTWDDAPVEDVDINALLSGPATHADREEQTDAEQVIVELLEDEAAWPMEARTALEAGSAKGIHERTLRRTAQRLGIRIARAGFGPGGRWVWHRPIADSTADSSSRPHVLSPMSAMTEQAQIADTTHIEDTKNPPPRAREDESKEADRERY